MVIAQMIKVCDAIMGSGKSTAAINYMNAHPDKKFIYITPYLPEAARIKESCPTLHFQEPSKALKEFDFKKSLHSNWLIQLSYNISSTHKAFSMYTAETIEKIKDAHYTLLVDENLSVIEKFDITPGDIDVLIRGGYLKAEGNMIVVGDVPYDCEYGSGPGKFQSLFMMLKSRHLVRVSRRPGKEEYFFWTLPPELIYAFDDVIVMTYLFEGSGLEKMFRMYNMPFEYIYVQRDGDDYMFSDHDPDIPEYVAHLKDMVHICKDEKLNAVGDKINALSKTWCGDLRHKDQMDQIKRNLYNYFRFKTDDAGVDKTKRMWSCYKDARFKLRGKGYSNSFAVFNERATNRYRDRRVLAYIVNVYMDVEEKRFWEGNGVAVDEEQYALSIMLQWIWRSAIRDGKEIWIYIPSRRMRELLENWIEEVSTKC